MSHEPDPCPAAAQPRIVRNRSVKPGHPGQAFDQFSRLPQKKSAQHFQRLEVLISKRAIEGILRDFDALHGLKSVIFRYDYVHVSGLVDAHVPGLKWLESPARAGRTRFGALRSRAIGNLTK